MLFVFGDLKQGFELHYAWTSHVESVQKSSY